MPLTDTAIRKAKPTEKVQRLFDGGGLYLELSPAGGKWWRLKYRFDGKEKRISLGTYPDTSLASARDKRDAARKLLAAGADSGSIKKNRRALRLFSLCGVLARQPKPRSNTHRTDVSGLAAYRQLFANTSIDDIDGLRLYIQQQKP